MLLAGDVHDGDALLVDAVDFDTKDFADSEAKSGRVDAGSGENAAESAGTAIFGRRPYQLVLRVQE